MSPKSMAPAGAADTEIMKKSGKSSEKITQKPEWIREKYLGIGPIPGVISEQAPFCYTVI